MLLACSMYILNLYSITFLIVCLYNTGGTQTSPLPNTYLLSQRPATIISATSDAYAHTLDSDTVRTIATSLVSNRLQLIQNSLARCVTSTSRFHHITPALKTLHWLKEEQRIQYKLISLTYSSLQHGSPLYLRRLRYIQTSCRSTRSTSVITLFKPSVKLETGKWSFSFAAPFLWNALPTDLRQPSVDGESGYLAVSRSTFHKRLKTHLFSKSYPP